MSTAQAVPESTFPELQPNTKPGCPWSHHWAPVLDWLNAGRGFLLTTHVNPDGDGLGALAALAHALLDKGRGVVIVLPTPMSDVYRFLFAGLSCPVWEGQAPGAEALAGLDRAVILDVSSLSRIGFVADVVRSLHLPLLVLDHHLGNEMEAELMASFPGISSTGEVLGALLSAWGVTATAPMAQALYAALTTDTGGFAFSSTSGDTLALAATLVRAGALPSRVHEELNQNYPASRYDLMARFLASRRSHADGVLLEFELSREMLAETGSTRDESEGFPNIGLGIRGCRMTFVLCELDEGGTKVNLRCNEPYDVCEIARALGGGGHRFAAGATLPDAVADLRPRVLHLALTQIASR